MCLARNSNLRRSKSTGDLNDEIDVADDSYSDATSSGRSSDVASSETQDRSVKPTNVMITLISRKLNVVYDQLQELRSVMDDIVNRQKNAAVAPNTCDPNERAKSLLDVIIGSESHTVDEKIKRELTEVLQCEELMNSITSKTTECLKSVIEETFTKVFPGSYLPIMEECHKRLVAHVTDTLQKAFKQLESNSPFFFNSVNRVSHSIRLSMEKHQKLLDAVSHDENLTDSLQKSCQEILKHELISWRQELVALLTSQSLPEENTVSSKEDCPEETTEPISPPQPSDPRRSIIDQLLKSAKINDMIRSGDVNSSFENALSSSDLSLVMAACRAADVDKIFSPCLLQQSVLLSLVQQLTTDMVHDTQLKCSYIEEALINVDPKDPSTGAFLPLVVKEVLKNLSKFLNLYPNHMATKRIVLIMAVSTNLLDNVV